VAGVGADVGADVGAEAGADAGAGVGHGAVAVAEEYKYFNNLRGIKKMEQEDESPATPVAVITIDSDLRKRVRIRVAQLGTTIKSFCEEAILNHLDSQDDHK